MKKIFFTILFVTSQIVLAQSTGTVKGKLLDKEMNNEALSFANVVIKGTTIGATTEMDGTYELKLKPGSYTIVFSFLGYKTIEVPFTLKSGEVKVINRTLTAAEGVSLEEVKVKANVSKEKESALLIEQKKAVNIKESIGAQQLSKLGVSDASGATTKIAGVSKSDGAGQIYVRGLGDRYLTTTLNDLPIPSDNIDKKNIDLGLFPTRFIQNVSISKTFSLLNSSDQASGNINVTSKDITKRKEFGISYSSGLNSNASKVFDDFKVTAVNSDITLGLISRPYQNNNLQNALVNQTWNTSTVDAPLNYSFGFNAGGFLDDDGKFRVYFSGGQSIDHEYREGLLNEFDLGRPAIDFVPDGDNRFWRRTVNTTGMLTAQYRINDNNRISFNAFAINKVFEELYESGRSREAVVFEELTPVTAGNQFIRDQNIKTTLLSIAQILGTHNLSEDNKLDWAIGYNRSASDEPNRIRNEVNIMNANPSQGVLDGEIQLGNTGGFQQRKTSQEILDNEINGRIKDVIVLKKNEDDDPIYSVSFGGDARYKQRDFNSIFIGFDEAVTNTINPSSIDNLSEVFTQQNINNGNLNVLIQPEDSYAGELISYAGFVDFVGVFGKFSAELGLRFQSDEIDVNFDIGNYIDPVTFQPRIGSSNLSYNRVYPAVNLKYSFNDKTALRFAGSLSQTLPEFKEIAPFQYVSPIGLITRGNTLLEASRNLNLDLKFEFFPSSGELLSLTTYYKNIQDPINKSLALGGEDLFSYFNTSDNARVFGLELEGRAYIIKKGEGTSDLKVSGNVSYINHEQDLKSDGLNLNGSPRTFQYRGITKIGLEGASDWTTNLAFTFNSGSDFPYEFTLAGNYASDRIFALGAPRNQNQPDTFFNGEIIEQGVVVLDLIFRKDINKHLSFSASAKNLLNPVVRRYQLVSANPATNSDVVEETVLTYTRGVNANLSINYKF